MQKQFLTDGEGRRRYRDGLERGKGERGHLKKLF